MFEGEKIMFHQIQVRKLPGMDVESWTGNFSESDRELLSEISTLWSGIFPTVQNYTSGLSAGMKRYKNFYAATGEEFPFFDKKTAGRIVGIEIDGGTRSRVFIKILSFRRNGTMKR